MNQNTIKNYTLSLLVFIGGSFTNAFAQSDNELSIKGRVLDAESNKPIANAWVKTSEKSDSTQSDVNGNFLMPLKQPGFYVFYAQVPGYKSGNSAEQLVTYDKQIPVTISLESLVDAIDEVNIRRTSLQKRDAGSPLS